MNIWQRIFYAGAKLFGPQVANHHGGYSDDIDEAGVVAALVALGAKMAKAEAEIAKVSIRNARKDANNEIKKTEVSEDEQKNCEIDIQKHTDVFIKKTDEIYLRKEKDILTV